MKTLNVYVKPSYGYYGPNGLYKVTIGEHELEVGQKTINLLTDMAENKWGVSMEDGEIEVSTEITVPYEPHTCETCGKRIFWPHSWCEDCLRKILYPKKYAKEEVQP